jgi:hypothetical protein
VRATGDLPGGIDRQAGTHLADASLPLYLPRSQTIQSEGIYHALAQRGEVALEFRSDPLIGHLIGGLMTVR